MLSFAAAHASLRERNPTLLAPPTHAHIAAAQDQKCESHWALSNKLDANDTLAALRTSYRSVVLPDQVYAARS